MTPMEVIKIRLQAQMHSLADPLEIPRYRNAGHAVYTIVREEGGSALYRGVSLTALRQATNQGAIRIIGAHYIILIIISKISYRCELYCVPGNQKICTQNATRPCRSSFIATYGDWSDFWCNGTFFQCTN